jgi:hypothetical protein
MRRVSRRICRWSKSRDESTLRPRVSRRLHVSNTCKVDVLMLTFDSTPWLVQRRRTCPICKGDVVRSMAHADQQSDQRQEGEIRSDDIQARAAETVNNSPTAAIPILPRIDDSDDDSDVERGTDTVEPSSSNSQSVSAPRSAWRNLVSGNLSNLSGDTVWRQTPADRNR